MWRTLLLAGLFAGLANLAHAQNGPWEICQGSERLGGPVLTACRPASHIIDPQGRELWIRSTVQAPTDFRPRALYIIGTAASEAWLNGQRLGANGRPSKTAGEEIPGRYQKAFPIRETAWRPGGNTVVLRLSAFHGPLRLDHPMAVLTVAPYPMPSNAPMLAVTFVAAGMLFAAAFGFGVIHAVRRTGSSLLLAAMAGVAGFQAIVESLRPLFAYAYPLHAWRLGAIWLLSATFALLLVAYVAGRFLPGARTRIIVLTLPVLAATALAPGFDFKTGLALLAGVAIALAVTLLATIRRRQPGVILALTWLTLFLVLGLAFPRWLVDLSFFLLAAGLVLPLLMVEVVRLGRDDQNREAALTRAVAVPDRLTVASARGVDLVPIADIVAIVGADDYVELRLVGGRSLLHAARLDRLEADLPPGFLRIHRSTIANLARADRLEREGDRWRLRLGELLLPVSRSRLPALRETLDGAASL